MHLYTTAFDNVWTVHVSCSSQSQSNDFMQIFVMSETVASVTRECSILVSLVVWCAVLCDLHW